MNKDIRILYVEDDESAANEMKEHLEDDCIDGYSIIVDVVNKFEEGLPKIKEGNYNIIILDLCDGANGTNDKSGIDLLEKIQKETFIPIIFYTGHATQIKENESDVVKVVGKASDGVDVLIEKIKYLIDSRLSVLKDLIFSNIDETLKDFFWTTIHPRRGAFNNENQILSYLFLRRIANSFNANGINSILEIENIDKVHPLEFYVYPTNVDMEYESGEIIEKDGKIYVILTPSCDFSANVGRERKVGKVLLAETILLTETDEYKKYKSNDKYLQSLINLIESRKGDRFYFLPETPFINNRVIDFQLKVVVNYSDLENYNRIAKLDSPFCEGMISSFGRYYNRIGYPDIDVNIVMNSLK